MNVKVKALYALRRLRKEAWLRDEELILSFGKALLDDILATFCAKYIPPPETAPNPCAAASAADETSPPDSPGRHQCPRSGGSANRARGPPGKAEHG